MKPVVIQGEYGNVREIVHWIASDLFKRFQDADGELFLGRCNDRKPKAIRGPARSLLKAFCDYCDQFPAAWVYYAPDHSYGLVSRVVGHCGKPKEVCATVCGNYRQRLQALLVLTRIGPLEISLGSRNSPANSDSSQVVGRESYGDFATGSESFHPNP